MRTAPLQFSTGGKSDTAPPDALVRPSTTPCNNRNNTAFATRGPASRKEYQNHTRAAPVGHLNNAKPLRWLGSPHALALRAQQTRTAFRKDSRVSPNATAHHQITANYRTPPGSYSSGENAASTCKGGALP